MNRLESIQSLVATGKYSFVLDSVNWKGRRNLISDSFNVTEGVVQFRGSKDYKSAENCTFNVYDISDDAYYETDYQDIVKNFDLFLYTTRHKLDCIPYFMFHKFSYKHLDIDSNTMYKYVHSYFSVNRSSFGSMADYIGSVTLEALRAYGYSSHDDYLATNSASYAGVKSMEEARSCFVYFSGGKPCYNRVLTSFEHMKRDWVKIRLMCQDSYRFCGKNKWYLSGFAMYQNEG